AEQHRGEKDSHTEYQLLRKDGSVFPALVRVVPIVKNGKPVGLRGVIVDVTELKQIEAEVLKLRKLESVGVLAGGIAHDFNNLLAGLFGNIEMAKRFIGTKGRALKYLDSAGESMARATALTKQLLTFAKGGDPINELISLPKIITEMAEFSLRGSNVDVRLDIDSNLWQVDGDSGQLSQVISNLVINAQQSMPSGGSITISASNILAAAAKNVQIVVEDQGCGIDPQYVDKIFDPYFSTKENGSGLGLASCYAIIKKHNGSISVDSKLNRGTTFTIIIPAAVEQDGQVVVKADVESVNSSFVPVAVLLLEDEESLQQMTCAMLEEMGHRVDYADNGEVAIEKYRNAMAQNRGYDIVICDLTIPGGMGGQDAAQKILEFDPQATLIVSSGYANNPVMANFMEYGFKGCIAKPYRFAELQKVIQSVLDSRMKQL
ncbi:MAG: response regulator, partial [Desulfuromonadales bacterium]|nr:response regulator [Desulfuromonadales bacterium]